MMNLTYTLNTDDLRDYYLTAMSHDKEIRNFHWKLRLFVPAGILFFLMLAGKQVWVWLVGITMIVVWLLLAELVIFKQYQKMILNAYLDPKKMDLKQMHITISDKEMIVNKTKQKVQDYAVFEHMLVVIFESNANILIPYRILDNDANKVKELVDMIEQLCPKYQKEVVNG